MTAEGRAARKMPYQASAARLVWALSSATPATIAQGGTSPTLSKRSLIQSKAGTPSSSSRPSRSATAPSQSAMRASRRLTGATLANGADWSRAAGSAKIAPFIATERSGCVRRELEPEGRAGPAPIAVGAGDRDRRVRRRGLWGQRQDRQHFLRSPAADRKGQRRSPEGHRKGQGPDQQDDRKRQEGSRRRHRKGQVRSRKGGQGSRTELRQ